LKQPNDHANVVRVTNDNDHFPAESVFGRRESVVRSYCRKIDMVFETASGSWLVDASGTGYLDFLAGAGALNYGHNDPDMQAALIRYIERNGVAHGLDLHTRAKADFLTVFEHIVLAPRGLDYRVQFTGTTGANGVEAALKLARKITGRSNVIAFTNAFHGVSLGALSATGSAHHRMGLAGLGGVTRMPFDGYPGAAAAPAGDTADLLDAMLSDPSGGVDAPAAILLETVQGEGGLNVAANAWLRRVAEIAHRHGALLIVDDIQAGCGRTGTFFSFEESGITPDLVVLSKSISGMGLPMALLLIAPDCDTWSPGEHNGTFRGNQHAFVTARVALEKYWSGPEFAQHIAKQSALVSQCLTELAARIPGSRVKGRGMMQGLDVRDSALAARIQAGCLARRLVIETAGPHDEVLKVFAPLTTSLGELGQGLEILGAAVTAAVTAPHQPHAQNTQPHAQNTQPHAQKAQHAQSLAQNAWATSS
jgi:diaminobutyrate-2-oxoglutarate transaminase